MDLTLEETQGQTTIIRNAALRRTFSRIGAPPPTPAVAPSTTATPTAATKTRLGRRPRSISSLAPQRQHHHDANRLCSQAPPRRPQAQPRSTTARGRNRRPQPWGRDHQEEDPTPPPSHRDRRRGTTAPRRRRARSSPPPQGIGARLERAAPPPPSKARALPGHDPRRRRGEEI